jgi:hypothetical protein
MVKTGIPVKSGIHLPPSIAAVFDRYPGRYSQRTKRGAMNGSSQGSVSVDMNPVRYNWRMNLRTTKI